MPELVSEEDLSALLKKCPEWESDGSAISRTLEFEEFPEAIEFVNDVAELAEDAQHHPDIDIRYASVTLRLTTHDAGGLTASDLELAQRIDRLSE